MSKGSMRGWFRAVLPQRICGEHNVHVRRAWQLVGGRRWSPVLLTDIQRKHP